MRQLAKSVFLFVAGLTAFRWGCRRSHAARAAVCCSFPFLGWTSFFQCVSIIAGMNMCTCLGVGLYCDGGPRCFMVTCANRYISNLPRNEAVTYATLLQTYE
ncbi:hypothetical protein BDV95DRAFT_154709 [Massariosphaeria phaeospora]|uniref:Uncharacterized protein n=1 Tax=Massariosphaeria phaeospora TaxID=100035 RepID=A0A7C8IM45_9PLEO|nr:hypothetical protein BDV95DRAFT_154709 [Massariosphaeria phaeospora]